MRTNLGYRWRDAHFSVTQPRVNPIQERLLHRPAQAEEGITASVSYRIVD